MPQPAKPQNSRPGSTPLSRRRLLAGAGGAVAAGALFSRAGFASAAGQRSAAGRWFATSAADKPTLSQWYHGYGEEGVEDAVRRFAADYPDANVEVQWFPADYDSTLAAALLTDDGPDVFEIGNGPNIDMITTGQVLPLDGILGDAESDFNERLIKRLTYDGHLWAVPQIIDMFFLVYRKSWLADAGIEPPATVDDLIAAAAKLTTGDHSGLFLGNDGGVGTLGGMALWSAGADYLTDDNQFGFANDDVYASFGKLNELYQSNSLLLGAPTDWSDPGAFINELTAIQLTGLWTFPAIQASAIGDDFDMMPWPALSSTVGGPSLPVGAFSSTVSARTKYPDAAKAFVKWLWVDNTDAQLEFALDYGFHIPARNSLAEQAEPLKAGAAASALAAYQQYAFTQTPVLWTPASDQAYSDARTRMITEGADPAEEIAKVQEVVDSELARLGATATSATVAGGSAPTGTEAMGTEAAGTMAAGTVPATTG